MDAVEFCLRFDGVCPLVAPELGYTAANIAEVVVSGFGLFQACRLGMRCSHDVIKQLSVHTHISAYQRVWNHGRTIVGWLPLQLVITCSVRLAVYSYKLYADIPCFGGKRWIACLQCWDLSLFLGFVATNYIRRLLRVCFHNGTLSTHGCYYKSIIPQAVAITVIGFLVAGFMFGRVHMSYASFAFMVASLSTGFRDGCLLLIAGLKLPEWNKTQSLDTASALARLKFLSLFTPCYIFVMCTMCIVLLSVETLRDNYGHCLFIAMVFLVSVFTLDIIMSDHKRLNVRKSMKVHLISVGSSPRNTHNTHGMSRPSSAIKSHDSEKCVRTRNNSPSPTHRSILNRAHSHSPPGTPDSKSKEKLSKTNPTITEATDLV